ncbi:hypothetical protein GCM10028783_26660 [Modestobacter muralis]
MPGQVAGGEQVEDECAQDEEHDADAGVGDGVADAGQHERDLQVGTAERAKPRGSTTPDGGTGPGPAALHSL